MKTASWIYGLIAVLMPGVLAAQNAPKVVPALGWDVAQQGGFPTSIAADNRNAIWVGTEGSGVWRYDPAGKKWTQFTTKDGLGDDDVYAVAVDKLNRVWVGHLNHGVSVWNGAKWKNYGLLDGPLGDRVFSIAICPTDGDVWMATDLGLARYSISKDDWDYFSRASGLPSNQIQSIAFDAKGNLLAGTQCEGLAMADAAGGYKKWRTVTGPVRMPASDSGDGLSSNLINDVTFVLPPKEIESDGMPLAAVSTPLGVSVMDPGNKGKWSFIRGKDWKANVAGLYNAPDAVENLKGADQNKYPEEDWVTCVRQASEGGHLWIGYRQKGLGIVNLKGDVEMVTPEESESFIVRAILRAPKSPPLIAAYDEKNGGLKTLDQYTAELEPLAAEPPKEPVAFPSPAKAPDKESIESIGKYLDTFKVKFQPGEGAYLGDDWRTEGDWMGRYGNSYAALCGMVDPMRIYAGEPGFKVSISSGPHQKEIAMNSFVSTPSTDDPHVLYDPTLGTRRDAEDNDGSFARLIYPPDWEGPDLWVDVTVPEGVHCVSLYFQNNDAHKGRWNKLRDYDIQLLPWSDDRDAVQKAAPIARARVTDFQGGVYKQFMVAGPFRYIIRVGRNRSFVTKLQGVFIDRLSGEPPENGIAGGAPEKPKPLPGFDTVDYEPPALQDESPIENNPVLSAANEVWKNMDEMFAKRGLAGAQLPFRIWIYRAAAANGAPPELLALWRWQIGIWTPEDRAGLAKATAAAFKSYSAQHPQAQPPPADNPVNKAQ